MVRPKSPTALLWAFELRREHTALLARLGALERKEEERRTTRDAEEVVETIRAEEVGNELRGLGSTVEGLEVRVDGLVGRVDEVEVEGRRRNESGLELGKRVERLAARCEEIAAVGVRPEAEAEVELRNGTLPHRLE